MILVMLWFMLHMVLIYVQRSDQLRMHHKTLQQGDAGNYVQNLTFYAGQTQTGAAIDSFVEKLRFTETPFEESPHKWVYLDKSDEETHAE